MVKFLTYHMYLRLNVNILIHMEDMICDIGEDSFHQAHVYDLLKDDLVTELYPGCSCFSRWSAVL